MKRNLLFLCLMLTSLKNYAANIYSTATGGNWSDITTWVGGVLPGTTDNVYIEAGAVVTMDMDVTVNNLRFNATFPAFGTLLINDAVTPKILTAFSIQQQHNANSNGYITVSGAAHEIRLHYLTIFAPAGTNQIYLDMPVGKLVFLQPPGAATQANYFGLNSTFKAARVEFGDGITTTSATFEAFQLYPNGRAVITNNCTAASNNLFFNGDTSCSLVIKNGGTFISTVTALGTNNGINMNLGENEADIVNGTYIQNMQLRRFLTTDGYTIPQGTYGNLYINETTDAGGGVNSYVDNPKTIAATGTGQRKVRIVGNFECKRTIASPLAGANYGHANVFFKGGVNDADCANVTWEFAGINKTITIGRDAKIFFKNNTTTATAAQQPKVLISGNVTIEHVINMPEASTTAFKDSIDFYHLTVNGDFRFGTSAIQAMPITPSPEHHRIKILGDLTVNGTMDFAHTVNNIIYFDNQSAATYSGTGTLHASKIAGRSNGTAANASKITSTLNEIFLEPDLPFINSTTVNNPSTYLFAGRFSWFEATAGTFRFDNMGWHISNWGYTEKMIIYLGIDTTQRIAFNNITVEDSTSVYLPNTFKNTAANFLKINGNIDLPNLWGKIESYWSTNYNNYLELGGTTQQQINLLDSANLRLFRLKINNPAGVVTNTNLTLSRGGFINPIQVPPQLQLVNGVLKMGANADKTLYIDNIVATMSSGLTSSINDGASPINTNDYSDSWVHGIINMVVKQGSQGHNGSTGPNYYEFPVGTATHPQVYRISTNVFNDYYLNVRFVEGATTQPNPTNCFVNANSTGPDYGAMNELVNNGYWDVQPHVPLITGQRPFYVTLLAKGYTNGNVTTPSAEYGLVLRDSATAPWVGAGNDNTNTNQNTGTHTPSYQTESNGLITARRDNVIGLGQFAIAKAGSIPLSLAFTSFSAMAHNNSAKLNWNISTTGIILNFEIEHSMDGMDWQKIGQVDNNTFHYTAENVLANEMLYRIKAINVDGKQYYSSIQRVSFNNDKQILYPNPATNYIQLSNTSIAVVRIMDITGAEVLRLNNTNNGYIDISNLPSGTYFVNTISKTKKTGTLRFVKL